MHNVKIQTSQNVDIEYELAGVGDRILATIADLLILAIYGILVLIFTSMISDTKFMSLSLIILLYIPCTRYPF